MSISLVHDHLPLLAPPLEMPLQTLMPGGLLGMCRERDRDSHNTPAGAVSYRPIQYHTGFARSSWLRREANGG